jgi:25S rRNA (uracil2843-N3)-methyltransferase
MHEQKLLDCLESAMGNVFHDPQLQQKKRYIKQLFAVRDFQEIFTNTSLLEVYCAEYIPVRSLAYSQIFKSLPRVASVLALGAGNGAELLGFASLNQHSLSITVQDMTDYHVIPKLLQSIQQYYTTCPKVTLSTGNLINDAYLQELMPTVTKCSLITAMFVLNELLSTSKKGFSALVSALVSKMPSGCLLLVVDSAGSFSEVKLQNRTYMLFELLDSIAHWDILESEDSVWYRFDSKLSYPLPLNNMRYYKRLYRKK